MTSAFGIEHIAKAGTKLADDIPKLLHAKVRGVPTPREPAFGKFPAKHRDPSGARAKRRPKIKTAAPAPPTAAPVVHLPGPARTAAAPQVSSAFGRVGEHVGAHRVPYGIGAAGIGGYGLGERRRS